MVTISKRILKGYVRYDGQGRLIPGSFILRQKMPKVGKWIEVPIHECCNQPTFECVSYSVSVLRGDTVTFTYTSCDMEISGPHTIEGPVSDVFCAVPATIAYEGTATFTLLGECVPTTTTTTTVG